MEIANEGLIEVTDMKNLKIVKFALYGVILLTAAISQAAKVENLQFVQKESENLLRLTNGEDEIVLKTRFKIEADVISVYLQSTGQKVIIASIDKVNSNSNITVSNEKLSANVLVNKKQKKFKLTTCSHMGCFPDPHFETYDHQLLEITTSQGQVLCWNKNVLKDLGSLTLGACPLN